MRKTFINDAFAPFGVLHEADIDIEIMKSLNTQCPLSQHAIAIKRDIAVKESI